MESLQSSVPEDPLYEKIPEVSFLATPFRHNYGKLSNRYSPDVEKRRSKYLIANCMPSQILSKPLKAFVHKLSSCHVPSNVEDAFSNPKWAQAINEELKALQKNKTCTLVSLPEGKKSMGCKLVFSIKYKVSIDRHKARLVAKGYTHIHIPMV